MVNHTRSGTQAPQSANLMRHMSVRTNGLIPGEPKEPSPESKEPSPGSQGTVLLVHAEQRARMRDIFIPIGIVPTTNRVNVAAECRC